MVLGSGATDTTPSASVCPQELPVNSGTKGYSSETCWERAAEKGPEVFWKGAYYFAW